LAGRWPGSAKNRAIAPLNAIKAAQILVPAKVVYENVFNYRTRGRDTCKKPHES
jgi:hypothetical protein